MPPSEDDRRWPRRRRAARTSSPSRTALQAERESPHAPDRRDRGALLRRRERRRSRSEDEGEPETVTTDRERDLSLLENARDLLDQVERALAQDRRRHLRDAAPTAARRSRPPASRRSRMRACASHASGGGAPVDAGRRARAAGLGAVVLALAVIALDQLTKSLVVRDARRGRVASGDRRHPAAVATSATPGAAFGMLRGLRRDPRARRAGRRRRRSPRSSCANPDRSRRSARRSWPPARPGI